MKTIKVLTPEEARRALYIDFEGRKDHPPVLLGCTRRSKPDWVRHYVTDPRYAVFGESDELEVMALSASIERIIKKAESGNQLIVAWTWHERKTVRDYCPELADRFEERHVNAKLVVERWRNSRHGGEMPASGKLGAWLELIGHGVPPEAAPDRVGDTLRAIDQTLERAGAITAQQRRRWSDLRAHNRHDCVGMRKLCILAADDIAAKRASTSAVTARTDRDSRADASA